MRAAACHPTIPTLVKRRDPPRRLARLTKPPAYHSTPLFLPPSRYHLLFLTKLSHCETLVILDDRSQLGPVTHSPAVSPQAFSQTSTRPSNRTTARTVPLPPLRHSITDRVTPCNKPERSFGVYLTSRLTHEILYAAQVPLDQLDSSFHLLSGS